MLVIPLSIIESDFDMRAPKEVEDLVKNFKTNIEAHKSGRYNEEQLRTDYLNPFFIALGWDVSNQAGKIEAYRDVLMEAGVNKKNSGRSGRVDYAFKLQKTRKFFVEAKKPKVDIYGEKSPAFQIREYGWWGRVSIGVLTDFEEFAVYNTHYPPKERDKAHKRRLKYFRYDQYLENWSFFQDTFSRQAVADGSLEKLADTDKDKEKIITVDALFLDEIEKWRKKLASDIAKRNKNPEGHSILNLYDLNLAVQTIIDRIIFLKFAEARGMEAPQEFRGLEKSSQLYAALDKLFLQADKKYNSGLFKRDEDREFISKLQVGDGPLRIILAFLEKSSYGFKTLPVEILGSIYERFLGKTIYFTKGENAKVEEKPETRKAGGVYYTPQYIVDYIVENTVGEKLKDQKWNGVQTKQTLTILDPACGSGSFLVNAYEKLLNWHLEYYSQAGNTALALKEGKIYEVKSMSEEKKQTSKTYRLSIVEKQRILLNSIYGVDLDRQAVEVSKLSLLLKLMEDENVESEEELFKHSDLQMLPDLSGNIKCGNSLIGCDFYKGEESLFPIKERQKVNVFDWEGDDGFPEIMKAGGFDCVIGNPPYVSYYSRHSEYTQEDEEKISYYKKNYDFTKYPKAGTRFNTVMFFIEKCIHVLKRNGLMSQIVDMNLDMDAFTGIRQFMLKNVHIREILKGLKAFEGVNSGQIIFIVKKEKIANKEILFKNGLTSVQGKVSQASLLSNSKYYFELPRAPYFKLEKTTPLECLMNIKTGVNIGGAASSFLEGSGRTENHIPFISTSTLKRKYQEISWPASSFINFSQKLVEQINHANKKRKSRNVVVLGDVKRFIQERIFVRQSAAAIIASYSEQTCASPYSIFVLNQLDNHYSIKFLLGLLNSKLLTKYAMREKIILSGKGKQPQIRKSGLSKIPIIQLDLSKPDQKTQHDKMVSLVDRMLFVQKKLDSITSPSEKAIYQKDVDRLDRDIDTLAYELYELTPEEIRIVEGETTSL